MKKFFIERGPLGENKKKSAWWSDVAALAAFAFLLGRLAAYLAHTGTHKSLFPKKK
ncbi:MAG: hypothetical protein M1571_09530 [Firmicutes bacterium]|nr:hypothetical protein [Bacillota bacterium]